MVGLGEGGGGDVNDDSEQDSVVDESAEWVEEMSKLFSLRDGRVGDDGVDSKDVEACTSEEGVESRGRD